MRFLGTDLLNTAGTSAFSSGGSGGFLASGSFAVPVNGELYYRGTVSNAAITTASKVYLTAQRTFVNETEDIGFIPQVFAFAPQNGSFDFVLTGLDYGGEDVTDLGLVATITLNWGVL